MSNNEIDIRGIKNFKDMKFIIPAYQRGYRWGKDEIEKLVDDLLEFRSEDECYCLQPIVVQQTDEDGQWHLIDGQQRLTTAYIITLLANQKDSSIVCNFQLNHEARQETSEFLKNLCEGTAQETVTHPDFHYIRKAKSVLQDYIAVKDKRITQIYTILEEKTRFIWYEIDKNANGIELFQKLNVGKVPLTNAELIKAILLNKSNFTLLPELEESLSRVQKDAEIEKMQRSIANKWDTIEQRLDDESFWNFIAEKKILDINPRIGLVLESVALDLNEELPEVSRVSKEAKDFSFFVFFNWFSEQQPSVYDVWRRIERKFSLFNEWFENDEWYHLIGYLIRSGATSSSKLAKELNERKKSEITDILKKKVKKSMKFAQSDWTNIDTAIEEINYDRKETKKIRNFLLLFNVLSVINKKEGIRFPFDKYEEQEWNIEHIHALADRTGDIDRDETINTIHNLALLDQKTNSEYKNKPFNEKRLVIRARASQGRFVPLCTQNIFFKVYTNKPEDQKSIDQWNEADGDDYCAAIKKVFDDYFVNVED